jgi:DDE superfamily endonuclease
VCTSVSMTPLRGPRQEGLAGGAALAGFRKQVYACLRRCPDALAELGDSVLTAPGPVASLPYLSLEPAFRRGHGMIYKALARGRIDEEALRDLLVAARPRDWPAVFAVDASTFPRPAAATSPDREWHHHSCPGRHARHRDDGGDGGAVVAGWAFQWLSQLSFAPDSWTAPQDQARVRAGRGGATRKAAQQVIAHAARLRADGEARIPLYAFDGGYDEAPLTWDLREHLEEVQILVRVRNDRVLYRDPPPRIPGRTGRPRIHGARENGRLECAHPATWGPPDQELGLDDDRYGRVSVKSWAGLHPKLFCRGRFAGFAKPPVIRCHLIRVTVTRLPNGRRVPGPLWLWRAGPGVPDLDLTWRAYIHRFRHRAHLAVRQDPARLGQGPPAPPGAGLPLDLADPLRHHPAPPRPPHRRRPPPALGTPPPAGKTQPRPGPPGFQPPGRACRHARQATKTLQARPRTAQRPQKHPRNQVPRPQESHLKRTRRLKRKLNVSYSIGWVAGCSAL